MTSGDTVRSERARRADIGGWMAATTHNWLVAVICLVVWQLVAERVASVYLPTPIRILETARRMWLSGSPGHLWLTHSVAADVVPSVARVLGGWAIATVLGVLAGIGLGLWRNIGDYVDPLLAFARAIPVTMLLPVFFVILHVGSQMQVTTIAFVAIWPILLNTIDGVRNIDPTTMDTVRAYRTPYPSRLGRAIVPAALPKIFPGLRVAMSHSLTVMVVSELVGSANGIGYKMLQDETLFAYTRMWAGIMLLAVLGYVFNKIIVAVQHRALRWHRGVRQLDARTI